MYAISGGEIRRFLGTPRTAAAAAVAASFVPLHVASNTKGLATFGVGTFEGLLARVGMAVDP